MLGVVSASQDPAMNNMTLTSSSGDAAFESLSGGSIDENLQAGNGELLSAKTHVVSGSSVDDIKNLFDSGTVQGGDTVYLANRTFSSDWQEWMNPINVNVGNIVITGANTSNPNEFSTINANQAKVFSLNAAGITLTNIKFVNSQGGGPGSAVNIQASDCTINNCAFNNCQSPNGGAIGSSASASNVKITNCNFTNNVAKWSGSGGAVYLAGSGNEINGCNFDGNTAGKYGAVFSAGTIEVKNSNFTNNNAGNDNGGALYIQGANSVVDNCNFIGNEVTAGHLYGGAVALYGSASSISSSNFERNKAGSGGAVLIQASNIDIDNCNFTSNSATSSGGAIYIANNFHNASMSYCNFEDNAAASGKAIFAAGSSSGKVSNCDLGGVTDLAVTAGYPELIFTLSTDYSNIVVGNIEGASGEGSKVPVPDEEIRLEIRDSNGVLKVNVTNKTNNQGQVTYDYSNLPKGTYTYTAYYMNGKSKTGTFGIIQVEGDKFSNIQSTIDSASSGAIIFLKNIIYTNDIDGNMVIDKPISIIGVDGTVLNAEGKSRIFNINDNVNNVVLDNIEFINGISKENGGAINIGSNCANVNILNSNFTNNRVFDASQQNWPEELGHGGAIAISGSAHNGVIANSTFINNTVPVGGGAIKNFGGQGWKIDNSTFINNTAQGIFTNNPSQVPNGGGALWSCMAQMAIINSTFIENEAPYGGGIRGFVDTYDCEFYFNVATNGNGGGIDVTIDGRVQRPRLEFVNTTFVNNTAKGKRSDDRAQGGALHMYHIEHVDMIDCKCYNNTADRGGAIDLYIIGTVIVANSDIENNTAHSEGGGFYINTTSSPSEFLNSNVTNNKAGTDGGAIYLITDGAFFDNIISVNNTASRGGSAFIRGHDAIIQHSTFNNNSAINNGTENSGIGGAFDILGNNCQLINVTSKYNNATLGGSTFIRGDHTKIRDSTFDYNNATLRGGGINVAGSDCNVTNVDVSGNFAGTDGGAVYVKGNHASFVDVGSYNNTACRGGSTFIEGDFVDVHNCTLDNNKALFNGSNVSGRGGGLDIAGENCQIYDLDVSNNTAEREGGAFYVKSSNIHFYDIQSMNNTAQRGGSSYIRGNNITVSNSTFDNNRAVNNGSDETGLGGALDILGNDCKFINVESLNNNATLGGSTFIRGNNTLIKNCTLDNNYASERGGGLDIAGNNCTVIDVDLSNNRAKNDGGAVYVRGNNATFEEVDSLNNTAARGGSSFIDGNNTRITNCDLDNNTATIRGGGLDVAGVNCTVINVTLSNCNATQDGGAVYVRGNKVLFDNVTSKNNIAQRGGSSFIQGNNITVQNCHLDNNRAIANGTNSSTGRAGGLDIAGDGCTIVNVTLSNNYGDNDGGAVYVKGNNALFDNVTSINNIAKRGGSSFIEGNNITVKNSHLDNNNASVRGGGLDVAGDNCTFENVTLSNCHADEEGGAVYVRGNNNLFEGVTSVSNTASSGGSSCIVGNNATVKNCTLNKNSASFAGGAISITGDECKFYNNNISYNDAMFGGSIYVEGTNALFDNNNISYNEAYMGGAIAIESGENSKFTNNNITFNYASDAGGAVFVDGPNSNFTHNNISSNRAEENGGGILSYGENLYLEDIYGFNNTAQNGGFAAIMMADNMVVKNSTFASNHALGDISVGRGEGGAFHISGSQNANIQANFQHNTAVNGSAIYVDDYNGLMPSSVYIHDSLFYDNQAKSYLLIIDVDTLGSAANGTVPGVCECKCNCTASNSHATATNKNNVLAAMFENSSNHKAIKLMNILRANNVNCTCGCGCSGNCNVGSSCNCSCSKSKYIPTVFTGEGIKLIVYHMGGDNIANAIYNSNCGVVVNNISYPFYDINGNETVKRTLETDVTPVIGPENSRDGKDIYQYPFENNQVIRIIVLNETGDVVKDVTYGDINKTDIYGKTSLALNDLKKGSYTVKAIYKESTYYTAIENNAVFRVIPPTMVSKLTINETVNFGDNVQFEIIVNNTNNFTLHNVSITEIYNETELRFVNYTNQNLWNKNGNVFTYKGNLNANEVAKFTIIFKTLVYGNLNNMVSLKTNETGDQVFTANNKTTVNGSPNMTVKKVCLNVSDFVVVNDVVVFNVTVTNVGDCTLGNVNVSEQFDAGEFKFIRFIGENWSTKDNITFVYGNDLVKGGNATFTVYFKALTNGTLVNNVTARSNMTGDVNGTDKVTVYSPNMSVSKLTLNNTVRVDDQVVFTVVVTNTGDCDLGNISVVEQIPDGLAYKTFDGAGWSKVDDYVFNYVGALAPGLSASFNITFVAREGGNWTNVVVAKSNLTENKSADNVTFVEGPGMEVFKWALNQTVYLGNDTYFIVIVENTGNCDLHDIRVVEIFNSSEMIYINHNKQNLWVKTGDVFAYQGVLAKGESVNFTIWFKTLVKGNITNTVNATSKESKNLTVMNNTYVLSPNLTVQKVTINKTVIVGDDVYFMIVVTNIGNCELDNVTVYEIYDSNELDSITLINGKKWTQFGNTFIYDGRLAPGLSTNFTVKFTAKALGNITNTVKVSSNETANKTSNNNTTVLDAVCDVQITKSVNATDIFVNDTVLWTITVVNVGPSVAKGVIVNDTLPDGVEIIGTISNGGQQSGRNIVWNIGDLKVKDPIVLTFATKVTAERNITNVVIVNSTTPDSNRSNNKANNTTFANPICDLVVVKRVNASSINVNDTVLWTISVVNVGPSTAKDVIVNDTLPDGVIVIGEIPYRGVISGSNIVWKLGDLQVNVPVTIKFTTRITHEGKNNNIVIVNSTTPDSNSTNNKADNATYANPICDLEITKMVNATEIFVNDTVKWTITVVNNGPSAAKDVVVNDTIPSGLEFVVPENCTFDGKYLIWNIATLEVNAPVTLELITKVVRDGNITNIVVVNSGTPDSNESNNKANNTTYANPICDLEITKLVNATSVYVNDMVEWTIIVLNRGPSSAVGVVVNDTLPDGLEIISATPSVGEFNNKTRVWEIEKLDINEPVSLILVTKVKLNNTFTNIVTVNSTTKDSNESNNHAQNTTVANPICDLEITKLVNASSVNVGDVVKWNITVVNNGPSTARDVVVNDKLPDGVRLLKVPEGCTQKGNTVIWNIGNLKTNVPVSITLLTQIITEGNKTNVVVVNSTTYDSNKSNNRANNTTVANPLCDVQVTKSVNAITVNLTDLVKWTIVVKNNGPSTARDVMVADVLPDGLKLIGADASVGSYSNGVWNVGDLTDSSSETLVLITQVLKEGIITNIVTVNSTTPDTDMSNNRANNTTDVKPVCDVEVTKLVNASEIYFNDLVEWTVVVKNNGPSTARDVKVVDVLPDGLKLVGADASVGSYSNGVWNVGDLTDSSSETLVLITQVLKEGVITNVVTVNSTTPDTDMSNNRANNTTDVKPICDVEVTKSVNSSSVDILDIIKWTVVVKNNGPSTARDVKVADFLPNGLKLVGADASVGSYSNGVWNVGDLTDSSSETLVLITQVVKDGSITNFVTVNSTTPDSDKTNNRANNTTVVNPICDLEILKLVSSKKAFVGEELTWVIVVMNHGPSAAKDVKVQEKIPASLEIVSCTATKGTYDKNSQIWTIGNLNDASSVTLTLVTKVLSVGNITNPVEVSTSTPDNDTTNNRANNTTEAFEICDLELVKSSDKKVYHVGDKMHWIIKVINHGPSTARGVVVSDVLPSGVKFISYSASKGSYAHSTGEWDVGDVKAGETVVIDILCKVMVEGVIINNANVTSITNDTDLSNNCDNATIKVIKNETPDEPNPEPEIPTHEHKSELAMKNTGNPLVYLLVAIFAIFGCLWANRKE